jgi:hypothetical protein
MKHHWGFLEEKLGSDVVKYIIQRMLLPPEIDRVQRTKEMSIENHTRNYTLYVYKRSGDPQYRVNWKPSQIKLQNKKRRENQEEHDAREEVQHYIQEQNLDYLGPGDSSLIEAMIDSKVNEVYSRRAAQKRRLKRDSDLLSEVRIMRGKFLEFCH